jgi:nucleotide-binding universal stress UspA family protein
MYHTILVPLDQSERAERILTHVEDLAARYKAEVVLLYVVDIEPNYMVARPHGLEFDDTPLIDVDAHVSVAQSYLDEWRQRLELKGLNARSRIEYGPVVGAIIEAAERENADLIAMASHGRSGLARVFYGSTAAGVLQRIDRPLLLIRAQ